MTNPFRSLVGLRGVDLTAQTWVNDLTGMSTELVSSLAQPSDIFGVPVPDATTEVWERIHRNAMERLLSESLLVLSEKYDFQALLASTLPPSLPLEAQTLSGGLRGLVLAMPYQPDASLNIQAVGCFVQDMDEPGLSARVRILDLDAHLLLAETTQVVHRGYNRIDLPVRYPMPLMQDVRLSVIIDADKLTLKEMTLNGWKSSNACSGLGTLSGVTVCSNNPATYADEPGASLVTIHADLTRSLADLLSPRYTDDLMTAYRHLCAGLLLTEKLASPNLSVFTLSNVSFTEKLAGSMLADFQRELRPVMRLLSNELTQQRALTAPQPTPDRMSIVYGSYV